ncbi:aspartyl-tRNA synthetase [Panus rudis PR-1116 ss-1]|nr:aspartyl-tRNA synthetase [Panus rudis PR-1116 ss-1]
MHRAVVFAQAPRILRRTSPKSALSCLRLYSQNAGHTSAATSPSLSTPHTHSEDIARTPYPTRTHHCGALTLQDVGRKVVLTGWLLAEHKIAKKLSFFPLRDSHGTTQLVVHVKDASDPLLNIRNIPSESTVLIEGIVNSRPENQRRAGLTGDIEVRVTGYRLLNAAAADLPFMPSDIHHLANEELRLRHRYLDLRRPALTQNLRKRSIVAHEIRSVLHDEGFTEVETPLLFKSTPEGAREFLVPTRLSTSIPSDPSAGSPENSNRPLFYALPQSPQQCKQLLIASGAVDKYYQIARCFRDEDGRKDRQPEFTQVDLEMAWVSWGSQEPAQDGWRIGGCEVRNVIERVVRRIWSKVEDVELPERFRVMTYSEAMARFGSDKPDVRFGLEIQDITSHLPASWQSSLATKGDIIEAIVVSKSINSEFLRASAEVKVSEEDRAVERIEATSSDLAQCLSQSQLLRAVAGDSLPSASLAEALGLEEGGTIWLHRRARQPEGGSTPLGRLRLALSAAAQSLGDIDLPTDPHFLWITEFPLFTHADTDKEFLAHGRWSSSHHPFTAPMWEDIDKMYQGRINEVRGQHYDLVLNGVEIGGGSVRIHDASMQEYIFRNILQLDEKERSSFNHLLHALRCGAPPHGGIALGFDRLMAILCKAESIRDVIAFPKTGAGTDLLFQSPAPVDSSNLDQYGIQPRVKK